MERDPRSAPENRQGIEARYEEGSGAEEGFICGPSHADAACYAGSHLLNYVFEGKGEQKKVFVFFSFVVLSFVFSMVVSLFFLTR